MKLSIHCGSIWIPVNQRRYKNMMGNKTSIRCCRHLWVCSNFPRRNLFDCHSSSHWHVKWDTMGSFVCTRRRRIWKRNPVLGCFDEEQRRCSLWRQQSGRNTQAGESRPIPTVANYISFSLCLQGHCDTAFSQFATLSLNRCQSEQKIIICQTGLILKPRVI